ncbi:protein adenylyltransferase SelO [Arcobacter roscoffensis]|uniref:Protein nucleotidyltransferase YdiU n=1 Tax=Arcobacter roscoffensis TaxID=2961520 RepID=A0ABY5E3B7_9BACT|nr:protein adenylyltransferase SelO family protein [Arcobacter roscoffensis]UTJ05243.1 protein adenylyltransferase SelO family protein [Arcobacter roscoffensis]
MKKIETLEELQHFADYSLVNTLNCDPDAREDGQNHNPREVFSGHYVPVEPTPIKRPKYIAHSKKFFEELGFDDELAKNEDFMKMFSADTSNLPEGLKKEGWACGYALAIYGTEYYQQCPFQTGNGYGDGRAISILEAVLNDKRWEMQLKGGGRTPYCRGADGRAVLRSSIREFLAQEHMNELGISTSRSLSLYTSQRETVKRPWFTKGSYSKDPEVMIDEKIAISTRVAPSFLRVGQLELFGRRARKHEHPEAKEELKQIVLHAIQREYPDINNDLTLEDKIILFAKSFRDRLTSLISNWIRVGYCQGNFNSDNCSVGGFTLDYGPFGFIDNFYPRYQPWTGGGVHFSFFNQPEAAKQNFKMFCTALKPLLTEDEEAQKYIEQIENSFTDKMQEEMEKMWASKLGIQEFDEALFKELIILMIETSVDYTIFFRELSSLPKDIEALSKSFYKSIDDKKNLKDRWENWFGKWKLSINDSSSSKEELSKQMKKINPKYTLREWFLVPAYEKANEDDYSLIHELQEVMTNPYAEQSKEIEEKYYRLKPANLFDIAGVSHVSCSS